MTEGKPTKTIVELDECEYDAMLQMIEAACKILESRRVKAKKNEHIARRVEHQ